MGIVALCRVCQKSVLKPFFNLGFQPLANSLLTTRGAKEERYPLALEWCRNCGLVQLSYTVEPKKLFSRYVWVTGTSEAARKYADEFCENLIHRVGSPEEGYVLEIASNDGTFLLPFIRRGFKAWGIDPAKNIAASARKKGIQTRAWFFGSRRAKMILKKYGPARVIFARNVLPHVSSPSDFVAGIATLLNKEGVAALEVHYAKTILKELHYDSIYHEHLCYFTLKTLERLFNDAGLFIFDIARSPISGGSIVAYVSKSRVEEKPAVERLRRMEKRHKTNSLSIWKRFSERAFAHRRKLAGLLDKISKSGSVVVGYGASARSSTLLNFCGIDSSLLPVIADKNPMKQKRFTAGSGILIESPVKVMRMKPDFILVLAWNFAQEIMRELDRVFGYKGKYVIPLPNSPRILQAHRRR